MNRFALSPSLTESLLFVYALGAVLLMPGCGVDVASLPQTVVPDPQAPPPSPTNQDDEVPGIAYCAGVDAWDPQWSEFEEAVLELVNQERARGADCGSAGSYPPVGPLRMNDALRCAARVHSMDMGLRDYFSHQTPEGIGPGSRIDSAGFTGSGWAENIAWGYATPESVVAGWMSSDGHCRNIMNADRTETGVGYYEGAIWTQTFGRP